jgi:hypothetical protein
MKNPCDVPVLVHVIPVGRLAQRNEPTIVSVLYGSGAAAGSRVVSPAQTSWPAPVPPTARPWPKSTTFGHEAGLGGGDQDRWLMSQRAAPPMIMQPMLPVGDLNVARWTIAGAAGAEVVVVGVVGVIDVVAVDVSCAVVVLA